MGIPADPYPEERRGYITIQRWSGWLTRYCWRIEGTGRSISNTSGLTLTKRGALRAGTRCLKRLDKQNRDFHAKKEIYYV